MADKLEDITMDAGNLYREETYTDLKGGTMRKLMPVRADGTDDPSRPALFTASTQVMTPGGILPLSGEVEGATDLAGAVAGFGAAIRQGLKDLREEMQALQRERASQIVVPGRDVPGPGGDLLIH
ncbi:MAG: hypothetical protein IK066_02230 [Kiritimatiellae bacterium]|nr:hypothetical protein [Kiritimatiellia bacterium]